MPDPTASRPTLLLVHGAWHGAWCWEQVSDRLARDGWRVETVELPSVGDTSAQSGLHDDAKAVRAAIDGIAGPVVVVAHSYGGAPASEATVDAPDVRHIVYLTAFQLDAGESLLGLVGGVHPEWWHVHDGVFEPLRPHEVFYGDVPDELAEDAVRRLRPQSFATATDELGGAGWHAIPNTYVICEQDNAIPVFAQEAMAGRATNVERLAASHSPFLSQPVEVTRIITAAALG